MGTEQRSHRALLTADGGRAWEALKPDARLKTFLDVGNTMVSLTFLTSQNGWALLQAEVIGAPHFIHAEDGGNTWIVIKPLTSVG